MEVYHSLKPALDLSQDLKKEKRPHALISPNRNNRMSLSQFNGAARGNPGQSSTGRWLHLPYSSKIRFKLGLGLGSENRAELLVASTLLLITLDHGVSSIKVLRDYMVVIGSLTGLLQKNSIQHQASMRKVTEISSRFDQFPFSHTSRESSTPKLTH